MKSVLNFKPSFHFKLNQCLTSKIIQTSSWCFKNQRQLQDTILFSKKNHQKINILDDI